MPQSLAKIILHSVFSTKDRRSFLRDKSLRDELHHYIGGILNQRDCQSLIVGGVEDHAPDLHDFAWQNGYGMFSVGFSQIPSVRDYIAEQEEHHKKISFQDEFRELLRRYEIGFDERYVWD
jgi:REP element-mobilizing transposase RayT